MFRRICLSRAGKACKSFSIAPNGFAKAPLLCPSAVGSPSGPLQPKGKVSPRTGIERRRPGMTLAL